MNVDIKNIIKEDDEIIITVICCKPQQKETPWSNGPDELKKNNLLFQKYSQEYKQAMSKWWHDVNKIHLGKAQLIQKVEK